MGWTWIDGFTRADIIQDVTRTQESGDRRWTTLAKCVRGSNLWTVMTVTEISTGKELHRFICLFLLNRDRNGAGYKDINESMGPCEVNCPLAYLEMVPEADGEYGKAWRERVRAWHAHQSRKLVVGKTYKTKNCRDVCYVTILSLKPLRGRCDNGVTYRFPKRLIGEELKRAEYLRETLKWIKARFSDNDEERAAAGGTKFANIFDYRHLFKPGDTENKLVTNAIDTMTDESIWLVLADHLEETGEEPAAITIRQHFQKDEACVAQAV